MIKLIELEKKCSGCPSTWEGKTEDGKNFYARYRYGKLTAELNNEIFFQKQLKGEYDGIMDTDVMVNILDLDVSEELINKNLIDWNKAKDNVRKLSKMFNFD